MSDRLLETCKQCGTIYQYTLDLARDQLLVEVEEFSALRLLKKFKNTSRKLGGYAIRVVFTTRQEMIRAQAESIETAPHWMQAESIETAPQWMSADKSTKTREFNPSLLRAEDGLSTAVLYAHVDKETAEVKHDVLRQAFAKYGRVIGLASFRYKGTLHCLVQYPDGTNASESLRKLDGICIYDDCCILRVHYSNVPNLVFKDDGRGFEKLVLHNSQVHLSEKTVDNLLVWNPNKGGTAEQNRTKEEATKDKVNGSVSIEKIPKIPKLKRSVSIEKIPKIPKLSAISNSDDTSKQLQRHNSQDDGDTRRSTSSVAAKSKSSKHSQSTSSRQKSHTSKNCYHKFSCTPIRLKGSSKHKTAKSSDLVLKSKNKKLPSPVSVDSQQQQSEHKTTNTVKSISASSSSGDNVSSSNRNSTVDNPSTLGVTINNVETVSPNSSSNSATDSSFTLDAATDNVKAASPSPSPDDQVSSNDKISIADRPTFLDVASFSLSLDPSDCSDVDTDASASSDRRLANLVDQPVEVAVGCQDIIQSSVAVQCSMEDDVPELQKMVMLCHEQLDDLKKKSAEITDRESRNKELLQENASLKKLLNEVQNEMRQLKEFISTVAAKHDTVTKHDAATQVDPVCVTTIVQDEAQLSSVCHKAQQTDRQTDSPKSSSSTTLHKRSSSSIDEDSTYEPSKKKRKRKKIRSSSSSPSPSLMPSPENNYTERANGYALKIRKKFLHTHLQSFLKSQKFIKSKLDTMKEAMKSCSADLHKSMSKIVPQLDSIYDSTVKLTNLEHSGNEDELFLCINELSSLFPSLIADLNESLPLKVPGVSLTILSVLKKMEYLANEMNKYSPQSKTLAYGNASTGETTSVEYSSSSGCDTITTPTTPPPLLSLDEAMEMLDDDQLPQQSSSDSLECVTSLTISISTKFLQKVGRKRLFIDENVSTDEAQNGSPSGVVPTVDPGEAKELTEVAVSPANSHIDTITTACSPESEAPIDIEIVENEYLVTKSVEATPSEESDSLPAVDSSGSQDVSASVEGTVLDSNNSNNAIATSPIVNVCTEAPPTGSISQSTEAMPTSSANQNTVTSNSTIAGSLPPFNTIPSNQSCATTIQGSALPPYTASAGLHDQPHGGGFTPLLQQPYIPTPIINVTPSIDGLVIKWTLQQLDMHLASQVNSYNVCVYQGSHPTNPEHWHTIGEVQAMKLPMSCTLQCLQRGKIYHFAIQAISRDGIRGQFSQSKIIQIY